MKVLMMCFVIFFSDPRHRHQMHPEERAKVHGGSGMAVVAALGQANAHAQCQPHGRSAQVENGEITSSNVDQEAV